MTNSYNYAELRECLEKVIEEIILMRPALNLGPNGLSDHPVYLQSAIFQIRNKLVAQPNHSNPRKLSQRKLPGWLSNYNLLGPYERELLATFIYSSEKIIFLRGGTGSGKSSTISTLSSYFNSYAEECDYPFGMPELLIQYDLQMVDDRIRYADPERFIIIGEEGRGRKHEASHELSDTEELTILVTYIVELMYEKLARDLNAQRFAELILESVSRRSKVPYVLDQTDKVIGRLRRAINQTNIKSVENENEASQVIEVYRKELTSEKMVVEDKLFMALLPYRIVADDATKLGRALILILDNLDPVKASIQNNFANILNKFASSTNWGNLKIVLPLRVSTLANYNATLPHVRYEHESPNIIDVLFHRISMFLLFSEKYKNFASIENDEIKLSITGRLFSCWCHIIDSGGYISQMFEGLAGTNLRRGLMFFQNWCLSSIWPKEYKNIDEISAVIVLMRELTGQYLVEFFISSIGHHIRSMLKNWDLNEHILEKGYEEAAKSYGRKIAQEISQVAKDIGIIKVTDRPFAHQRQLITELGVEALMVHIQNETIQCDGIGFWRMHLEIHSFEEMSHKNKIPPSFISQLLPEIICRLPKVLADTAIPDDQENVILLSNWLVKTLEKSGSVKLDRFSWSSKRRSTETNISKMVERSISIQHNRISRYEVERSLLQPNLSDGAQLNAINVFTANGQTIAPIAVQVLYSLRAWYQSAPTSTAIIEQLKLHSFSEEEIKLVLTQMASISRRLVFSDISDEFYGVEGWFFETKNIYLTSAGLGYFRQLLSTPAYLQWALTRIPEVIMHIEKHGLKRQDIDKNIGNRLRAVMLGLSAIVEDEWDRINGILETDRDVIKFNYIYLEPACRTACLDVFYRSLHPFFISIRIHQSKMIKKKDRIASDYFIDLAEDWMEYATKYYNRYSAALGIRHDSWEISQIYCEKILSEMQRDHRMSFH